MPPRSALPLPRYVRRKPLKSGGRGYFFEVPSAFRKADGPMHSAALGADYAKAGEPAETVLVPVLEEGRGGGQADAPEIAAPGTLDWVFAEYRADRRFTKLGSRTKDNHELGFRMVGGYALKDGRRLGTVRLAAITTAVV